MNFEEGNDYFGFKLIKKEYIDEIKSNAFILEHIVTKAKVFAIKNDDNNKTFSIGFRTPPTDSTGVAHIIEHSVLCGSKKYPLKDLLSEAIKGSVQTFVNAFTFPDKTVYPCSSRNKKDYFNLMDVYLDAVLNPLLTEHTFKQEGWHYELNSIKDEITYKGVVYNEMKGAFSSPQQVMLRTIMKTLFPDTTYGVESGGEPRDIPNLTYQQFKDFHSKYYHPSNSYIYFYGDIPLEEELSYIQNNFLKDFSYLEIDSSVKLQKPFDKPKNEKVLYPITSEENTERKTILAITNCCGILPDKEIASSIGVIIEALYKSDASPLKKAIIDKNIADDVSLISEDEVLQPFNALVLMNTDEKHQKTFENIYNEVLEGIVKNGIDKELLISIINDAEFSIREEKNTPLRGLWYCMRAYKKWLYDESPIEELKIDNVVASLKKRIDEKGYFEEIIKKYFLENTHRAFINLTPDNTIMEKEEQKIKNDLAKYKESLNKNDLQELVKETKTLKKLQETPESKENLAKLPRLTLKDISADIEKIPTEIICESPLMIYNEQITNKIAYLDIYFNTQYLTNDELRYINIFSDVLISGGTKKTSYDNIAKKISTYTGGIKAKFTPISSIKGDPYKSFLMIGAKVITDKYKYLSDILKELLFEADFDNISRIKDLLNMEKAKIEELINEKSFSLVGSRLASYTTMAGKENELVSGFEYYGTVLNSIKEINENPELFTSRLKAIRDKLFIKDNIIINIIVDSDGKQEAIELIENINSTLPDKDYPIAKRDSIAFNKNEAFYSSSQVQYVGVGINLYEIGFQYKGSFSLLVNYLENFYLWDKIRVMGGAYGCFSSFFLDTGFFSIISYRDPNLKETLDAYYSFQKHLKKLNLDNEKFNNLIISTANEPLLSPYGKAKKAFGDYMIGLTYQEREKHKKEVLSSTPKDLAEYSSLFKKIFEKNCICVFGGEGKIKQHKDLFTNIVKVMK